MLRNSMFLLCALIATASLADRPNFIIFVADDMAWDDAGAYGNDAVRTPNIDRLANEGVRFDRAYLTCSSCSPSRCSIMTGRYPHSTGAGELHLPLPEDQMMMTKPLKDAGYWTAAVGKWHLGEAVSDQVDFRAGSPPHKMGEAWVSAVKSRPKDKPFFLWAAHSDPHRGYKPGAVDPPHDPNEVIVPPFFPDNEDVRGDLALYYDEVSRFDEHIGMVLDELENQLQTENTFVLVISDNGRPFPYCKTMVHVPGVRTPFVVRWPSRIKAGGTTKSVVSTVDIAPTILELAGLESPKSFQGTSFAPILDDSNTTTRRAAYAEHNWHDYRAFERAVHTSEFCYVRNWLPNTPGTPPADAVRSPTFASIKKLNAAGSLSEAIAATTLRAPRPTEFLYKVDIDPNCMTNLASDPKYQSDLSEMRTALSKWQNETSDSFPGEDKITRDGFDRVTGKKLIKKSHPSFE